MTGAAALVLGYAASLGKTLTGAHVKQILLSSGDRVAMLQGITTTGVRQRMRTYS